MAEVKDKVVTVESLSALHGYNKETYVDKTDVIPVQNGGTGATNVDDARRSLNAKEDFDVLSIVQGGTGAGSGYMGLKNLFASGETILSSYQYGNSLPAAGNKGRIFFKKLDS